MARPEAPSPSHAGTPGEGRQPAGWREKLGLYLICDLGLAGGRDPVQLVELALAAGVRAVQLRAKATPDRVAYQVALALRRVTARYGALLIVNDRLDLALAAGADGVHLGQDDLPAEVARRLWPAGLLGVSVRTAERARAAERAGADYLGAGALRSTSTKPDSRVIGLEGLRAVVQATRLPVVAIGGIRPEDVPAVRQIGAAGVAVASAILQAEDVRGAAKAFLTALTTT
ncbi:MAG: thiamine phosphate synthase [Bacillota bacterium]|nr:MAG: thiamine phosphate synthase [Bacillota bacterium]